MSTVKSLDITMCTAHRCPSRMQCVRYTMTPRERQSYALFRMTEDEEKCTEFISNKRR